MLTRTYLACLQSLAQQGQARPWNCLPCCWPLCQEHRRHVDQQRHHILRCPAYWTNTMLKHVATITPHCPDAQCHTDGQACAIHRLYSGSKHVLHMWAATSPVTDLSQMQQHVHLRLLLTSSCFAACQPTI